MEQTEFEQEIFITSTIDGLNQCIDIVYELSKQFELDFDTTFCLNTVLVEAVENAIIHGNRLEKDLEVRVFISISSAEIIIEVEDKGEGFDMNSIPDPLDGSVLRREGGRGIFFIKSLSFSCYTLGKGNIVRIKLKR